MGVTVTSAGLSLIDFTEVVSAMERLEPAANLRATQALQIAAGEVATHAKQNHDYTDRTGKLTASIRAERVEGTFATGLGVDMIAGARGLTYASHVEFGTRPHVIRPKRKKALAFVVGGKAVVRSIVRKHPGNRAFHFMRNALAAKLPRAEQLLETAMELAIEESGLS